MLERIISGIMAIWMAIVPGGGASSVQTADDTPETISVTVEEQTPAPEPLTLERVREVSFPDSPQNAADAVSYVAFRELMSGFEDGLFHPDNYLNAAQALRILRRIAARTDLDPGSDSASDVDWGTAIDLFYMEGDNFRMNFRPKNSQVLVEYDDGTQELIEYKEDIPDGARVLDKNFPLYGKGVAVYPETPVTRAQLALLLYRFATFAGYDLSCTGDLSLRPDGDTVPDYAKIPYSWVMEHNIYRTIVVDNLCPGLPVSRAQAALIFTALLADGVGEPVAVQITDAARNPFFVSKARDYHDAIQGAVDAAGQRYGATGLQVAVVERGHLTDTFAYGWATVGEDRMTPTHKMRIASISKVLVGLTAARMRQDGLVDYSEPFGIYWDDTFVNPAHPNTPVTLKTLLTHTSSLADGSLSASSVRSRLSSGRGYTSAVPGSLDNWEYSNFGFGVLGMTLERVGNRTLDQLLNRYFFNIMDIDASFYAGDLHDSSKLVTLYSGGSVTLSLSSQRSRHNPGTPGGDGSVFAGGLVISVRDLGKVAALLANDGSYEGLQLLSPESVRVMETYDEQRVSDGFYQAMPIRYRTDAYGREGIYYHTGSAYGVFNGFSYDPHTGDGVVVLTVGASGARDSNGNYAVCGAIFDSVYRTIQQ
ncbi:MAG: serine hydrolase [Oscillibacter sp.]|nr:serine hydrolase [Oscillibacter sp.]